MRRATLHCQGSSQRRLAAWLVYLAMAREKSDARLDLGTWEPPHCPVLVPVPNANERSPLQGVRGGKASRKSCGRRCGRKAGGGTAGGRSRIYLPMGGVVRRCWISFSSTDVGRLVLAEDEAGARERSVGVGAPGAPGAGRGAEGGGGGAECCEGVVPITVPTHALFHGIHR